MQFLEFRQCLAQHAMVVLLALLAVSAVSAASGDLDTSFGSGGKSTFYVGGGGAFSGCRDHAIQSDGKLIVTGTSFDDTGYHWATVRMDTNGQVDSSFGDGGVVRDFLLDHHGLAYATVIQPDGKIVVAGSLYQDETAYDFAIGRYLTNGQPDPSFGTNGKVVLARPGGDEAFSVTVDAAGRIVAAGYADAGGEVLRLLANGSPDTTFGSGGVVLLGSPGSTWFNDVVTFPSGSMLITGSKSERAAVTKLLNNGAVDTTYADGGTALATNPPGFASGNSIQILPDGGCVVAALHFSPGLPADSLILRYTADGSPEASFGAGGYVLETSQAAQELAVRPNGRIAVAGGVESDFGVFQLLPDGSLDHSFGSGGKVRTDFEGGGDAASSLLIDPQGRLVACGIATVAAGKSYALARYGGVVDASGPICTFIGTGTDTSTPSSPKTYARVRVQDTGSGLASVALTANSRNCTLQYESAWTAGTTAEVYVRAVKINQIQSARVELRVRDVAGNETICDPVVANLELKKSRQLTRTFKNIPAHEHYLTIENGDPGLWACKVWVNGNVVLDGLLYDGQEPFTVDVKQWMNRRKNTVRIWAFGKKGASAVLLIGDASLTSGGHSHSPSLRGGRPLNIEFGP